MKNKKPLAVYIHIPFCEKKCLYCDFLSAPAGEQARARYVEALLCDCSLTLTKLAEEYFVTSIFLGGGTPSVLKNAQIVQILHTVFAAIEAAEDAEVTMEVNPGTVSEDYFAALLSAGVNRISFGLQSVNEEELHTLGRIHDYQAFERNYHAARAAGFTNINVDLMYNLPGQTKESWKETLGRVMEKEPEHISAYSLIIEEGTSFYSLYEEGKLCLPKEDEQDAIDEVTVQMMKQHGYRQYEISNYAKEGYACRHNIVYWRRGDYIGIGLGAASLLGNCRFLRTKDSAAYLLQAEKKKFEEEEKQYLSKKEAMEEYMFLGLRMCEGVSIREFEKNFGVPMTEIYGNVLEDLRKKELLVQEGDRVYLSERGRMIGNLVFLEFV